MNFQEMFKKVQDGHKARRPHWKEDELLWWFENMLVHTTPYFKNDAASIRVGEELRYYYVVEKDDPVAQDWEIL